MESRMTYSNIMIDNLKNQPALEKSHGFSGCKDVLDEVCEQGDLILYSRMTHYITIFNNPTSDYIYQFLYEADGMKKLDQDSVSGLKHVEKSGVGVFIIVGDVEYFLFPASLNSVNCLDGYYDKEDRL